MLSEVKRSAVRAAIFWLKVASIALPALALITLGMHVLDPVIPWSFLFCFAAVGGLILSLSRNRLTACGTCPESALAPEKRVQAAQCRSDRRR